MNANKSAGPGELKFPPLSSCLSCWREWPSQQVESCPTSIQSFWPRREGRRANRRHRSHLLLRRNPSQPRSQWPRNLVGRRQEERLRYDSWAGWPGGRGVTVLPDTEMSNHRSCMFEVVYSNCPAFISINCARSEQYYSRSGNTK